MKNKACPVCKTNVRKWQPHFNENNDFYCDCPNCGHYIISGMAIFELQEGQILNPDDRAVLSHKIWQGQKPDEPFMVYFKMLEAVHIPGASTS